MNLLPLSQDPIPTTQQMSTIPIGPPILNYSFDSHCRILESAKGKDNIVEIQEYRKAMPQFPYNPLLPSYAELVHYRRVKIVLSNSAVKVAHGSLHFNKGNITMDLPVGGAGGLMKKMVVSLADSDAGVKPKFHGTGEIYLEPTDGYLTLIQLNNEEMIVHKGLYYACDDGVQIDLFRLKGTTAIYGENWFQTRLHGTGWVVLHLPIALDEIQKMTLNNEKLNVHGSNAFLRKGKIEFTVEKSGRGLVGSSLSGERFFHTFTGTGEVWLSPKHHFS